MPPTDIRAIKDFPSLIRYLRTDLGWPVDEEQPAEDLTFDYSAEELGLDADSAVKVRAAKQLRPLVSGQPWGIFWIDFEPKKLPVTVMRRILNQLVAKKRGGKTNQATWNLDDLLFISAVSSEKSDGREITFAHFHQEEGDLPTLRVLGWDGADTVLKIDYVAKTLREKLRWPPNPKDAQSWRETWAEAFKHKPGHVIKTADALAARLAELARNIRAAAETIMAHESERGRLRKLHQAFQTALIHDLSEADFADTYAQTITYGLLTAAISRTDLSGGADGTALVAENITDMVPVTNPFLKEMLQTFLHAGGRTLRQAQGKPRGIDFDELGIQDVVELLRSDETDLPAILRDFNNRAEGEDPVIRFYEDFLAAYDKALKVQRGVFYTPKPVVSYIVRGVHELLISEFGLEDGLADTSTWAEVCARNASILTPKGVAPNSFFVTILDPATGTATFLVEVIDVIYKTMTAKWKKQGKSAAQIQAAWNEYVPKYLLPRLYGYELMMAPYAIAHMKIGLKLFETGYHFASEQRVRVYLTNALNPESDQIKQLSLLDINPALAHEAEAVNLVKKSQVFLVIIGNPPYSNFSANLEEHQRQLINRYKLIDGQRIQERNALQLERNLNDDYVKFFAVAEDFLKTDFAVLGMITNNSYLTAKTLRGVRARLLTLFEKMFVLNLGGQSDVSGSRQEAFQDENVFDITQGVAVSIFARKSRVTSRTNFVQYERVLGDRESKYHRLFAEDVFNYASEPMSVSAPYFVFGSEIDSSEWDNFLPLEEILTSFAEGIKTGFDEGLIGFNLDEAKKKVSELSDKRITEKHFRENYAMGDKGWAHDLLEKREQTIQKAKATKSFVKFPYRPMDFRYVAWPSKLLKSSSFVSGKYMADERAICLILSGQVSGLDTVSHFYVGRKVPDNRVFYSTKGSASYFPLYQYETESLMVDSCVSPIARKKIPEALGLTWQNSGMGDLKHTLGPDAILYYSYAIFHSPTYRKRYQELLKINFPRLPLTSNVALFRELCALGKELVGLHLLEDERLENRGVESSKVKFVKGKVSHVEKGYPKYVKDLTGLTGNLVNRDSGADKGASPSSARGDLSGLGRVYVNEEHYFDGVREDVWNFHIGGYQVCAKWLKDRRERELSAEELVHYAKVVSALGETIRIMSEVDAVIEVNGGWPVK